jgi:ribulose-bisphosphate carboxylase large chain
MIHRVTTVRSRIEVTYTLPATSRRAAAALARAIALEQTAEMPEETVPRRIAPLVVGRVARVTRNGTRRWRVALSYEPEVAGGELPQLLNLLFGNVSLLDGIRVEELTLPPAVLKRFPGPRFGIAGLRRIAGVTERRPLLCAAAKPVGLTPVELAAICERFARGGVDIVKDDHSLSDQRWAPFRERVMRCQEGVARANAATGGHTAYFPQVSAPVDQLEERLAVVREAGCRGVLLAPMLVGLDTVRSLAERSGLAILGHPSFAGPYFGRRRGIAPAVLLGQIFRLIGSDGVIFPNPGGRFPWPVQVCLAVVERLRGPLGPIAPAMPVAGGGVDAGRVRYWMRLYGPDIIYLIGSSFYRQRDLEDAARRGVALLRAGHLTREARGA